MIGTISHSEKELIDSLISQFAPNVEPLDFWVEKVQTLPEPRDIGAHIMLKAGVSSYRANLDKVDFNES